MLAGALLVMAQPAGFLPAGATPQCPAPQIAFAPPLDQPLILTRRIERALASGTFVQTVRYRVVFHRSGRGYGMAWQQTGEQSEGPPDLLRLLSLQDDSAHGERLDFTLDSSGAVLGVIEPPQAPLRLARAIDRLRRDPALAARPERERTRLSEMLDRLATLPPGERAQIQIAKASRLLLLAGRPCSNGMVSASDGSIARITRASADRIDLAGTTDETRSDGTRSATTLNFVVSGATGLVERLDRRTTSSVAGTVRTSSETYVLERSGEAP